MAERRNRSRSCRLTRSGSCRLTTRRKRRLAGKPRSPLVEQKRRKAVPQIARCSAGLVSVTCVWALWEFVLRRGSLLAPGDPCLELVHALAQGTTRLGQPLRAQDQEDRN